MPWSLFAGVLSDASSSILGNASLISKVYFPRLIIPASTVITSFADFLMTLALMGGMMWWYGFAPDARVLALPFFMVLVFAASFGAGLWFAALNVAYRDFRYVIPFVVQLGLYISPVGFSTGVVSEKWRLAYALNPTVGAIEGFRWALLRGESGLSTAMIAISAVVTCALCLSGTWYFRRMEKTFADVI